MKRIAVLEDSLDCLRSFPDDVRSEAGFQLRRLQIGQDPTDWKTMTTVGPGVREIRIRDASGAFRVVYLASLPDRIVVLHVFQKKSQATPKRDIDLAARRLPALKG